VEGLEVVMAMIMVMVMTVGMVMGTPKGVHVETKETMDLKSLKNGKANRRMKKVSFARRVLLVQQAHI
jgi:hypothetical protein